MKKIKKTLSLLLLLVLSLAQVGNVKADGTKEKKNLSEGHNPFNLVVLINSPLN